MTCRETLPLLPLFFDGELEARQMRAVALHSTRCAECERELRSLERLQESIAVHVGALVDEIDLSRVWAGVAPRLAPRAPAFGDRVRAWWAEWEAGWGLRGPAFAGLAMAGLIAVGVVTQWPGPGPKVERDVRGRSARIDNSVKLDSMQSSVDSVALVTDAETNTTLLWIMDDAAPSVEGGAGDAWDSVP